MKNLFSLLSTMIDKKHLQSPETAVNAFWTFPVVVFAAFLIAWAAEAAQFLVSQGLALAILAWLQTLPEYAVEIGLAWKAGKNPDFLSRVTANFTGSIRLLAGLGIPVIYFIWAIFRKCKPGESKFDTLKLSTEHSVEVIGLFVPLIYFTIIYLKSTISIIDTFVLTFIYIIYILLLSKLPPQKVENAKNLPFVVKKIQKFSRRGQWLSMIFLFFMGGIILYAVIFPFIDSIEGLAAFLGISGYFAFQWIAPFLSEFPEKVTAFNWARYSNKASMGMMNFVSSNINQWTILVASIPISYSISLGTVGVIHLSSGQDAEVALTIFQSVLCVVMFLDLKFSWLEAVVILLLWFIQFLYPSTHKIILYIYGTWSIVELSRILIKEKKLPAVANFRMIFKRYVMKADSSI